MVIGRNCYRNKRLNTLRRLDQRTKNKKIEGSTTKTYTTRRKQNTKQQLKRKNYNRGKNTAT